MYVRFILSCLKSLPPETNLTNSHILIHNINLLIFVIINGNLYLLYMVLLLFWNQQFNNNLVMFGIKLPRLCFPVKDINSINLSGVCKYIGHVGWKSRPLGENLPRKIILNSLVQIFPSHHVQGSFIVAHLLICYISAFFF